MEYWDGVLRGGAAGLLGLLIVQFLRDGRGVLSARLGVMLSLAGLSYLVLPTLTVSQQAVPWWLPCHVLTLAAPGLFWLFAASWFDDEFALRAWHGLALAAITTLGLAATYSAWMLGVRLWPVGLVWRGASIAMAIAGLVIALRGRRSDLVESRRRLRLVLAVSIGFYIVWTELAELPLRVWPPPVGWRILNAAGLFALAATLTIGITGWRDPGLMAAARTRAPAEPRPEADDTRLLARLGADMRRERLYRQTGLTISAVAARLGVPEYRLRRAINQGLGERNFNAYLNGFRLAEVREALADPAQRTTPILTIALDAGFGSLAPFNRAFRAAEDCTPSEYRARALGQG